MASIIDAFRRERIRRRRIAVLTDDAYLQCGFYCKQLMFLELRSQFTLINISVECIGAVRSTCQGFVMSCFVQQCHY